MERRLGSTFDLTINVHPPGTAHGMLIAQQEPIWVTALHGSPHEREPLPLALLPNGSLFRRWAIEALARVKRPGQLAHESSNVAAIEAAVAAGLAVAVFQRLSVDFGRLRELTQGEGFPELPRADVLLQTAERFLPRAAVRLHEFLLTELRRRDSSKGEVSA